MFFVAATRPHALRASLEQALGVHGPARAGLDLSDTEILLDQILSLDILDSALMDDPAIPDYVDA